MKRIQQIFLIIFLSSGCSTHLTPSINSLDTFTNIEFTSSPVIVIKAQLVSKEIKFGESGTGMGQIPKTIYGNLHEWTETACNILKKERQSRTTQDTGKSPKTVHLSIAKVEISPVTFTNQPFLATKSI